MRQPFVRSVRPPAFAWCLACAAAVWLMYCPLVAAADIFDRSRAMYAALTSYADTGMVMTESAQPGSAVVKERHTFTTFYRAPRHYYFEFNKDKEAGADRFVIWSDDAAFHTWWKTTGVDETYPVGKGAGAFAQSDYLTKGSALQITPLLFSKAGLVGTLTNFINGTAGGAEEVGGRRCERVVGMSRDIYTATGKEVRVRRVTVWIDAENLLVRKVLEDTPSGMPTGVVMRVTTTFEPQANPTIDDARFRFKAPDNQK